MFYSFDNCHISLLCPGLFLKKVFKLYCSILRGYTYTLMIFLDGGKVCEMCDVFLFNKIVLMVAGNLITWFLAISDHDF